MGVSWYEMLTGKTPDPAAVGAQQFPDPSANADVTLLIRLMLRFVEKERPTTDELIEKIGTLKQRITS